MESTRTASTEENSDPQAILLHSWRELQKLVLEKCRRGDSHHISFQLTSRAEDSWILENDSGSSYLRQVVILIAVVVPDVGSSLEQINTSPGSWYAAIDVASAFLFTSINKDHQKHSAFSRQGQQHTFTIPPQRCVNSLALRQSFSL